MSGLDPTDQLELWPILLKPLEACDGLSKAKESSAAGRTQLEDIQQMLQRNALDTSLASDADPKRRFMHALATAALKRAVRVHSTAYSPPCDSSLRQV